MKARMDWVSVSSFLGEVLPPPPTPVPSMSSLEYPSPSLLCQHACLYLFWSGSCFSLWGPVPHRISLCLNEERAGFCHNVNPLKSKCFPKNCWFCFLQNSVFVLSLALSCSSSLSCSCSLLCTHAQAQPPHACSYRSFSLPSQSTTTPCSGMALATTRS